MLKKKLLAMLKSVLAFLVGAKRRTAEPRHGQLYYVHGHHPFIIQPTVGANGKGTFEYPELELAKLKIRAETETDAEAMFQQGIVELYGITGDPKVKRPPNYDSAMRWFRLAASLGHAGANSEIYIVLTRYPDEVKPLYADEAADCLEAARKGGDPLANACAAPSPNEAKRPSRRERRRDFRRNGAGK